LSLHILGRRYASEQNIATINSIEYIVSLYCSSHVCGKKFLHSRKAAAPLASRGLIPSVFPKVFKFVAIIFSVFTIVACPSIARRYKRIQR
jgi:hypothetical protein